MVARSRSTGDGIALAIAAEDERGTSTRQAPLHERVAESGTAARDRQCRSWAW